MLERLERIYASWDAASLKRLSGDEAQPEELRRLAGLRWELIEAASRADEEEAPWSEDGSGIEAGAGRRQLASIDRGMIEQTRAALDAAMEELRRKYS